MKVIFSFWGDQRSRNYVQPRRLDVVILFSTPFSGLSMSCFAEDTRRSVAIKL